MNSLPQTAARSESGPHLDQAPRVTPNAWRALGGVWRLTLHRFLTPGHALALLGLVAALAVLSLATVHRMRVADLYFGWVCGFYLTFVVPIIVFISAAGAFRDDIKPGAVDYLFTRPVRRPVYVAFRYLAHTACTQVEYLLPFAMLVALGVYREVPGVLAAIPMLLVAQFLVVAAFSAFGFLAGVLTSRYIIVGLVYGGLIEVGIGHVPTQLNRLSMTHQVLAFLRPVLFDTAPQFLGLALRTPQSAFVSVGILAAASVGTLAIAAAVFALQELAGAGQREP
jgi:ABC-2 type transport system permease protein